jgi:hypothetical protein
MRGNNCVIDARINPLGPTGRGRVRGPLPLALLLPAPGKLLLLLLGLALISHQRVGIVGIKNMMRVHVSASAMQRAANLTQQRGGVEKIHDGGGRVPHYPSDGGKNFCKHAVSAAMASSKAWAVSASTSAATRG